MSTPIPNIGGFYPYKMDAKCRVSIPSDWRAEMENTLLRLLVSHNEGVPTLRVLTEFEFDKIYRDFNESEKLTPAQKRTMIGTLYERCTKTQINEQGKLSIPKSLLDHPGLKPGEGLMLCGRGSYIEILNEENYNKLDLARKKTIEELNEDFGVF